MKKSIFAIAVAALILGSCGGADSEKKEEAMTVCDCVRISKEMMKDIETAGSDMTKMSEIEEKYKNEIEACKKLGEGKTDEEMKKLEEEAKNCK